MGHQQAHETGVFLDSLLSQRGIQAKDIIWLSSPFLRCLQTSNDALNAFSRVHVETLPILPEYSIFEWDGNDGKWHEDLPPLAERKHYFPRLDVTHQSLFVPTLPGSFDKKPRQRQSELTPKFMLIHVLFSPIHLQIGNSFSLSFSLSFSRATSGLYESMSAGRGWFT